MDRTWKLKVFFTLALVLLAALAVWPTVHRASATVRRRLPAPRWVVRAFREIVPGLDLRGGLRLVYQVEVDRAIKDKLDRYSEDMRDQLARDLGIQRGKGFVTRQSLEKLAERVRVRHLRDPDEDPDRLTPEERARQDLHADDDVIELRFTKAADMTKVDRRFRRNFGDLVEHRRTATAVQFRMREDPVNLLRDEAVERAKVTIGERIDELGLREASVTTREEDVIVEAPGQDEAEFNRIKDIISRTARLEFKITDDASTFVRDLASLPEGIERQIEEGQLGEGRTTQTTYLLAKGPNARRRLEEYVRTLAVPDGRQLVLAEDRERDSEGRLRAETYWRTYFVIRRADVTGEMIKDASVASDPQDGSPYVSLEFTPSGGSRFEEVTGQNVKRRMAIVLDDKVSHAPPVIQSRIGGGRAQITLGGTLDYQATMREARDMVIVLKAGSLPAPINLSQEQRIGAAVGEDSIRQGAIGALVGILLVIGFMILYYRWAGVIASAAVLVNLLFLMAALASAGAALTLPGIAAVALTVGMAVDANVLITERIREELRLGKTARAAVDAGYSRALSAIIDGQATTAIAGVVLWDQGTGPIKGFGITLIFGIACSVFTSVFCTRLVFDWLVRGRRVERLSVG